MDELITKVLDIPVVKDLTRDTYGVLLYQEQVIRLVSEVAGFSLEEADTVRKAIGKKDSAKMNSLREAFIQGALSRGYTEEQASNVFTVLYRYSDYSFNLSHSLAYSYLSYITAYLKTHYPAIFISESINVRLDKDAAHREKAIQHMLREAGRRRIEIVFPDLQTSLALCHVQQDKVVLGLCCIRGLDSKYAAKIVAARHSGGRFRTLLDFCQRTWEDRNYKGDTTLLIQAGVLDSLGHPRKVMVEALKGIEKALKKESKVLPGEMALFDLSGSETKLPHEVGEYTPKERVELEKAAYGFYLMGHPLELVSPPDSCFLTLRDAVESSLPIVSISVLPLRIKEHRDRRGGDMAFLDCEDIDGDLVSVTVFSSTWAGIKSKVQGGQPLLVSGRIERGDRTSVTATQVVPMT
jgi:DNA polymerase-3 subunit alpha